MRIITVAHRGHGTNKILSRHKQKLHGTNENPTARTKTPRHKQKLHGTNKNSTARTKTPRHKQKLHGANKNSTAQTKTPRHEQKLHGTNIISPQHKPNIPSSKLHVT
jgi:microcystin-dependent protein